MLPPVQPRWRVHRGRLAGSRGSMAVEMVIAVPGFLLLLLLIAGGANWVSSDSQVGSAARDAARAASIARSGAAAQAAAISAADFDLNGRCVGNPQVSVVPTGGTSFANDTQVSVTVTCQVNLQVFRIVGLDNTTGFSSQSVAPLDPFEARTQ